MNIYGVRWIPLNSHGMSMEMTCICSSAIPYNPLQNFHMMLWPPQWHYGLLWIPLDSMDSYGNLLDGIIWCRMESYGNLWNAMGGG